MPATPAEVANDLAAQARFFVKRDDDIAKLCRDSARLIRSILVFELVDEQSFADVVTRLEKYGRTPPRGVFGASQIAKLLRRALETLQTLRA